MDKGSFSKVISLKISGTWPSNSELYNPYLGKVSSNVFTDFSRSGPYVILLNYYPLNHFILCSIQLCARCDYSFGCYSGFPSFLSTFLLQMRVHLYCFIFYQNLIWNALVLFTILNTTFSSSPCNFQFPILGWDVKHLPWK